MKLGLFFRFAAVTSVARAWHVLFGEDPEEKGPAIWLQFGRQFLPERVLQIWCVRGRLAPSACHLILPVTPSWQRL